MKAFTPFYAIGAFFVSASFAQSQGQYSIQPDSVSLHTRKQWCTDQTTQCPLICLQTSAHSSNTKQNNCDPQTLDYSCVCSNGHSPNVTEYSETLPYFICTEWGNQCVTNCGNDNLCAAACRQNHPCGAQAPKIQSSTTTSHASGTAMVTGKKSGNGTTATATTTGANVVCSGFGANACQTAAQTSPVANGKSGSGDASMAAPSLLDSGKAVGLTAFIGLSLLGFALVL